MNRTGFSMIGLLFSLACMAILIAIAVPSMHQSMTGLKEDGGKAAVSGWGMQDQVRLYGLMQSMNAQGLSSGDGYPQPSKVTGSGDLSEDTTANLYSYLVMQRYITPDQLVSPADFFTDPDEDYDWTLYSPRDRMYWDPSFSADLSDISNVSYAHMPMYGNRLRENWGSRMSLRSSFPILGNRGPRDGVESQDSYACFDGLWGGYVAFGDGHVEFLQTPGSFRGGQGMNDGLFTIDDESRHGDAILGFTSSMGPDGPVLQWD